VDNGGDELTKALQAQIAPISTQCSRASRSLRTSCFTLLQHGASVQILDALTQLEQGSANSSLESAQRVLSPRYNPPKHRVSGRPNLDLKTHCSHAKGTTDEAI